MLEIEVEQGGGALIKGTKRELLDLAVWLVEAARTGHADPAFVTDTDLTSIEIVRSP